MSPMEQYDESERPVHVWCDATRLHVRLADDREVATPLWWYPRLVSATPDQLDHFKLMLDGVHWPDVDEDLSVRGMVRGWKHARAVKPIERTSRSFIKPRGYLMTQVSSLETKTDAEIDVWIANHERQGKTKSPLYLSLVEERSRRHGHGLTLNKSIATLIAAAKKRQFISYGELAEANGVAWTKARHRMNGKHGHLDDILAYCHSNGLPLLTAIVVQKGRLQTGEMDQFTLDGFIEGAQRIGVPVTDPIHFLAECQRECFDWAEKNA
jgi:hypothetical protein